MPTYTNSGNALLHIQGLPQAKKSIEPGETVQSHLELDLDDYPGLVRTSDDPRWNPATAVHQPSGAEDYSVDLDENTERFQIDNLSDETVTVYYGAKTNVPGVKVPSSMRYEDLVKGRVTTLVLEFSGEIPAGYVTVTEFAEVD